MRNGGMGNGECGPREPARGRRIRRRTRATREFTRNEEKAKFIEREKEEGKGSFINGGIVGSASIFELETERVETSSQEEG
jgi:hypothetical protein